MPAPPARGQARWFVGAAGALRGPVPYLTQRGKVIGAWEGGRRWHRQGQQLSRRSAHVGASRRPAAEGDDRRGGAGALLFDAADGQQRRLAPAWRELGRASSPEATYAFDPAADWMQENGGVQLLHLERFSRSIRQLT